MRGLARNLDESWERSTLRPAAPARLFSANVVRGTAGVSRNLLRSPNASVRSGRRAVMLSAAQLPDCVQFISMGLPQVPLQRRF